MTRRLPSGWKLVPLGNLLMNGPTNGYSPASGADARGPLTLRLSATTSGRLRLDFTTTKRIYESIHPDSPYWLEPGDLLVQRSNTLEYVGAAAIYDGPRKTYIYPDLMMRARLADASTTRWVWRFLNTATARRYFTGIAGGSAGSMPKITGNKLKALLIPLPHPEETARLVDILDKADAVRRKRKEAIALTEELLRSAFLEMFGDPVTNPKGWPVLPLGDTFSEAPRIGTLQPADDSGAHLVVRVGDLGNYDVALGRCKRVSLSPVEFDRFRLSAGDVVLARAIGSEEHLGKASVLQEVDDAVVFDSHVMRLRFAPSLMLPYFFVQWLRSPGGRARFMREAGRTAVQFNVNAKQMARVRVPLPPVSMQQKFVGLFERCRSMMARQALAQRGEEELFGSLVQRAFRGELTRGGEPSKGQLEMFTEAVAE